MSKTIYIFTHTCSALGMPKATALAPDSASADSDPFQKGGVVIVRSGPTEHDGKLGEKWHWVFFHKHYSHIFLLLMKYFHT